MVIYSCDKGGGVMGKFLIYLFITRTSIVARSKIGEGVVGV